MEARLTIGLSHQVANLAGHVSGWVRLPRLPLKVAIESGYSTPSRKRVVREDLWVRLPPLPLPLRSPDGEMDHHLGLLNRSSGFESRSGCCDGHFFKLSV